MGQEQTSVLPHMRRQLWKEQQEKEKARKLLRGGTNNDSSEAKLVDDDTRSKKSGSGQFNFSGPDLSRDELNKRHKAMFAAEAAEEKALVERLKLKRRETEQKSSLPPRSSSVVTTTPETQDTAFYSGTGRPLTRFSTEEFAILDLDSGAEVRD